MKRMFPTTQLNLDARSCWLHPIRRTALRAPSGQKQQTAQTTTPSPHQEVPLARFKRPPIAQRMVSAATYSFHSRMARSRPGLDDSPAWSFNCHNCEID